MKKVLKPSKPEDAVYYSDFSGALLDQYCVPATVKIECDYGSKCDGARWEIHLTDTELNNLLVYIKDRLCQETKEQIKKELDTGCLTYDSFYNKELYEKLI
jgi:hypothetical protein